MSKQSEITSFFSQSKTVEIQLVERETAKKCVHTEFYKNCLEEQKNECRNGSCVKAIAEVSRKKEEMREKIRSIEEAISMCTSILSDKDVEIERLGKQADNFTAKKNAPNNDIQSNACGAFNISTESVKSFATFSKEFTEDELSNLRSINAAKSGDSTFVATCVKYAYKQNLSALKNKSVTGKSRKHGQAKQPVTPSKYKRLSEIFAERVNMITKNVAESKARKNGFNKYMKDAISNINRKTQTDDVENACKQLE